MLRKLTLLLSLIALVTSVQAQSAKKTYQAGWIYLKLKDNSNIQLVQKGAAGVPFDQVLMTFNVTKILQPFKGINTQLDHIYKIQFGAVNAVADLMKALSAFAFVDYVEQVPYYYTTFSPNDYNVSNQYSLAKINAAQAWDISKGSHKIVIAVVDNAVSTTHNDLKNNIWVNTKEIPNNGIDDDADGYVDDVNGYDVANHDNNTNPPAGLSPGDAFNHGTHVSGIASAATNNGTGVASIGYSCKIMPVKCTLSDSAGGTLTATDEGIAYAIAAGANVINMSFGGAVESTTQLTLLQTAASKNIILVAAAGNDNTNIPSFPASDPNVISVGATDANDVKSAYSSYGPKLSVMAPGDAILSTVASSNDAYAYYSGTSMASPLTAGLCGLMLSENPNLTKSQVETFLKNGCDNVNNSNILYTGQLGSGRINAYKSMQLVQTAAGIKPTPVKLMFKISPNPAPGRFQLHFDTIDIKNTTITIYNTLGQVVLQQPAVADSFTLIDIPGATAGLYFVRVETESEVYEGKVVVY